MGRREVFHTFSLLVEIEGHFAHAVASMGLRAGFSVSNRNRGS
jgi:hypothetical protein